MEEPELRIEKAGGETVKRGVGSDLASHFATGAASGAGIAAGKAAVEHVIDTIKNRPAPPEPSPIVLPPGVKVDE
jgi:hypothetical protein